MKLKVLAATSLILIGVGAIALSLVGPSLAGTSSTQYITQAASVSVVSAQSVATGSIAASTVYGLRFGTQPDIVGSTSSSSSSSSSSNSSSNGSGGSSVTWPVKSVAVKVGDQVKKGQTLATADDSSARLALSTAQANLAAAQAKLSTDQNGPDATTIAGAKLSVTQAQNQLSQAVANQKSTNAQNALKVSQAKQAVTDAQNKLNSDLAAQASASPAPSGSSTLITQDQTALQNAKDQLASAQLQASASNQQASQQVTNARLGVQSAQNGYATKIAPATSATIMADQAQVASDQAAVQTAHSTVDGATLVAPADGLIIAVNVTAGVNAPTGYVMELQVGPMVATASFTETDITNIKLGQAATVTVNAAKTTIDGTVSQIVPVASSSSGSSSVVTYTVTVELKDPPASVLSGMTATISVITQQAPASIAVPATALQGSSTTGYFVRVMGSDGTVAERPVQVGLVTSSMAQITSGLNDGERVVIGTSGTRTNTTAAGGNGGINLGGLGGGGGVFQRGGNGGAGR